MAQEVGIGLGGGRLLLKSLPSEGALLASLQILSKNDDI
jgi:hypothetical protein